MSQYFSFILISPICQCCHVWHLNKLIHNSSQNIFSNQDPLIPSFQMGTCGFEIVILRVLNMKNIPNCVFSLWYHHGNSRPADTLVLSVYIMKPAWPFPWFSRTVHTHRAMGTPPGTTTNIYTPPKLQWLRGELLRLSSHHQANQPPDRPVENSHCRNSTHSSWVSQDAEGNRGQPWGPEIQRNWKLLAWTKGAGTIWLLKK